MSEDTPHVEWAYSRPAWVADDGLVIPFPVDLRSPSTIRALHDVGEHDPRIVRGPSAKLLRRRRWLGRPCPASRGLGPGSASSVRRSVRTSTMFPSRPPSTSGRPGGRAQTWGPAPLDLWLRLAAVDTSWPPTLSDPVPSGVTPQRAFLDGSDRGRTGSVHSAPTCSWRSTASRGTWVSISRRSPPSCRHSSLPLDEVARPKRRRSSPSWASPLRSTVRRCSARSASCTSNPVTRRMPRSSSHGANDRGIHHCHAYGELALALDHKAGPIRRSTRSDRRSQRTRRQPPSRRTHHAALRKNHRWRLDSGTQAAVVDAVRSDGADVAAADAL